jgi:hypothetical protein
MHLTINSETSNRYTTESRGGRDYLVTKMMPIAGDTVMNSLYYPMTTVANSYGQLDKLPAPAGHPVFNGKAVSALDPEGGYSFSVGAFVRNPVVNGLDVIAELAIDTEVANRSEQGRDVINRIKTGQRIGVSTGLNGKIDHTVGTHNGTSYAGVLNEIRFDHVALLLDEAPAGANTYTINSRQTRGCAMRTVEIDTEALSLEDHAILTNAAKFPKDLVQALTTKATVEEATAIITNSGKQVLDAPKHLYEAFLENRDHLSTWLKTQSDKRAEKVEFVVDNSGMSAEDISGLSDDALDNLLNSVSPKNVHIAAFNSGGNRVELDLSLLEA